MVGEMKKRLQQEDSFEMGMKEKDRQGMRRLL